MDRNREARKSTMTASANNGLSRRRQRSSSLRDSPEEEGGAMEMLQETTARLRDRGGVMKKDRSDRERLSRNRKRRGGDSRLNNGVGEESSEESVNDDEEDDYEDDRGGGGGGGGVRMFAPPPPSNQTASVSLGNHQYVNRKSFPPSVTAAKVIRPAVGSPGWKPADQVIGFSVPRKARSASGKRPQEFSISNSGVGPDQINRQTSTSPVRLTPSPSPVSPPSSSNAPIRKKMKPNGSKPRPPKSGSKPSSSNPEELEIEIAEVLYGMMTQSHSSSKKESDSVNPDIRETNNNKSRVSSPISNSTSQLPQNSSSSAAPPLSAVAPKRKRPRQVTDNLGSSFSVRHSPVSSMTKVEADLPPKKEISSPNAGSAAENGSVPLDFASSQVGPSPSELPPRDSGRPDVGPAKEEAVTSPKKESPVVRPDNDREASTMTKADSTISAFSAIESQREEKFEIDLMAPPPQMRSSPEREGEINFVSVLEQKPLTKKKEGENCVKSGKEEKNVEPEQKRAKVIAEEGELEKKPVVNPERKINNLQLDLEKQERDISVLSGNKLNPDVQKPLQPQPPKVIKDEPPHTERVAQSGSLPLPMSVASWPGGPPMGYMAPLQGVVSMDGNTVSPAPVQPLFSHPRPKRCATHCYIARNIHYLQQFMKMNPFWPPPAGSAASLFGAKPCNLNLMPSAELQGNNATSKILNSVQEKGQGLSIFPGQAGKDKGSQASNIADAQRKQQQIMLQQALPPGAPNNILHGPAFIFPLQQAAAAAAAATASVRPGSVKPPTASGNVASTTASTSASGSTTAPAAATAVTFNYPNMPANETQFLAILQNNPYPFVGAPPAYRGTHAQAVPFFNGSFYSSQMMHPAQLQQQQQQQPSTQQQNTSSGSSSSHKHLHSQQQQQRPQGSSGNNLHNFPAPKKTNQHMPNAEVGGEDSPSTADSRVSRASKGVYSQNFAAVPMPIHSQNFALMSPALSVLGGAASGGGSQGEKKQQQGLKAGVESMTPTFAMSFGSMSGVDMSSAAQNHAVLQSLPESTRHTFQMMQAAAAAQNAHQKKNFRVSEEVKTAAAIGDSSNNVDEEKKNSTVKPPSTVGQQSIVFSRTDLPDSISTPSLRSTRSSTTPNAMATANAPPNAPLQAQLQYQQHQQQMMHQHQLKQHQQQQQQQFAAAAAAAARNKPPSTSNGSVYSDHLASSAKFPNGISNFPQNLVQSSSSSSPGQSHQWKNSMKTASQVPTTASSLKSPPQQQTRTQHNQTQISFGAAQKPATPPPPQGQQAAASHRAPSPPMAVGSPTTSSISKGANGSPRTTITAASAASKSAQPSTLASSQPPKNTTSVGSRNVSSVLSSNSHVTSFSNTSAKPQIPQQQQQQQQQQQMFISHFMQAQVANQQQPFYLQQRRRVEQSQPVSSATSSSTGMLSLSSPVTGSNASTSDAKAAAASATSAAASNLKGGGALPSHHLSAVPPGFSYVHAVPSPGQVKPAEQKQPAGNRDSLTRK